MELREDTIQQIFDEAQSDHPAVTELATVLAQDWCEQWGGWPEDIAEQMAQVWACRPQARKLLGAIKKYPKSRRYALARAVAA